MDISQQFQGTRALTRQRNIVAAIAGVSLVVNVATILYSATRPMEVILQPVIQSPVTISSSHVSRDYLEFVTRDTAFAVFNRTPQSLDYWMNSVLKITDPAYYGQVKARLLRAMSALRGSDITQMIDITSIDVQQDRLTSEVYGTLHVYQGNRVKKCVTSD